MNRVPHQATRLAPAGRIQSLLPIASTQTARGLIRLCARLKAEVAKSASGEAHSPRSQAGSS